MSVINKWIRFFTLVLFVCFAFPNYARAYAQWNTYQANEKHNGYLPLTIDNLGIEKIWSKSFSESINPVVGGDGFVFVSEHTYYGGGVVGLYSFNANNGEENWSYKSFGKIFNLNPPAYNEGKVYIQASNATGSPAINPKGQIYNFDASTGSINFQSLLSEQWYKHYAPTPYDGDVYVNNGYYGGASRFDGQTGNQVWFKELQQYDEWTPAVDDSNVYAYLGGSCPGCKPNLTVIGRESGTIKYTIDDPGFVWNTWSMNLAPVLGGNKDIIVINGGRLINFDLEAKDIAWQLARNFIGQPSLAGGKIYAIDNGKLTVWNELTGAFLWDWSAPSGRALEGTMIVTDSHIFLQTDQDTYGLDLLNRDVDWSYHQSGSLALSDNKLYIAGNDKVLTAFALPSATVTPEPASMLLFGTGLVGLFFRKKFIG